MIKASLHKKSVAWGLVLALGALSVFSGTSSPIEGQTEEAILFLRLEDTAWQLWRMAPDGSHQEPLTQSNVDVVHASHRPGTSEILYHTNRGETFLLDLATRETRTILADVFTRDAKWSSDGERLVYSVPPDDKINGKGTVWVSRVDGTDRQKVNDQIELSASPAWLNHQSVLFRRVNQLPSLELSHQMWIQELNGEPQRIDKEDEPKTFDPSVTRVNGMTKIAYSSLRSGFFEIWAVNLEEGEPQQITQLNAYAGNPFWSPDGKALCFDSDVTDGRVQVFSIGTDGEELSQLTKSEAPSRKPVWIEWTAK
jgi:Tol biopolymer transport system component